MSDELRIRLFLEQVEEVERLMQAKQQELHDVTVSLDASYGQIADLKRQKARQAAQAAVAVAKVAQKDAEIKLAEEELGLLQEKAEERKKEVLEMRRQEEIKAKEQLEEKTKELAELTTKLAEDKEKVAKARELLCAMNFEEQHSKLQEKLQSLREQEAKSEAEHSRASQELQALIGDVDRHSLETQTEASGSCPWPDLKILREPVRTMGDCIYILKGLGSERKLQAARQVIQQCQKCLSQPASMPDEDTESVTEPQQEIKECEEDAEKVASSLSDAAGLPEEPKEALIKSHVVDINHEALDKERLTAIFAEQELFQHITEELKQVADNMNSFKQKKVELEKKIQAVEVERLRRTAAVEALDREIQKQRAALSECIDL